jgi:hypothetical protein
MRLVADALTGQYQRRVPLDLWQPCWPWRGEITMEGYGRLTIDGAQKYSHRLSYQLHVGPIPRGWEIDHACHDEGCNDTERLCPHRACWNPAHLQAVSSRENSKRGNHPLHAIARRQQCARGHDLRVDANVQTRRDGRRRCRICAVAYARSRRASI